jgi:hypothetical protein
MPFGPDRLVHPGGCSRRTDGSYSGNPGVSVTQKLKTAYVVPADTDPLTGSTSGRSPARAHRLRKPHSAPASTTHQPSLVRSCTASAREEARVLLGPTNGAQRASRHHSPSRMRSRSLVGSLLAASLLASLIATPAGASAGSTVRIPTVTTVTTSAVARYWLPEELYYLSLVNCTRTGGWVLNNGTCRGYGSGRYSAYVVPLRHTAGISDLVARPYARYLADTNQCSHFLKGDPGDRLRRAGYNAYNWGENIGCRNGYSYAKPAILASHLFYQAEKSSGGGHWRNIKNPKYEWIGIGIWKASGRVRLVTDFYSG